MLDQSQSHCKSWHLISRNMARNSSATFGELGRGLTHFENDIKIMSKGADTGSWKHF